MEESSIPDFLATYSCKKNSECETYLREKALSMEKKQISRTYIALDPDTNILGFFTLCLKCMQVPDQIPVSNQTRKKMNVDEKTGVAQSYLIGQLGRDDRSEEGFGKILLGEALAILYQANILVGCRIARVDCSESLVDYYANNDFIFISKNKSKNLNQMVRVL